MRALLIVILLLLSSPMRASAWGPGDFLQFSAAFLTNLAIHESGHFIVGETVQAADGRLEFFVKNNGKFFLGLSSVSRIDRKSRLPYVMGGPVASGMTFEIALNRYRSRPNTFNRSLLFFSGTELVWYSIYSFYLVPRWDTRLDPVAISEETGLKPETILAISALQAIVNGFRVITGQDRLVPSFTIGKESATFRLSLRF